MIKYIQNGSLKLILKLCLFPLTRSTENELSPNMKKVLHINTIVHVCFLNKKKISISTNNTCNKFNIQIIKLFHDEDGDIDNWK